MKVANFVSCWWLAEETEGLLYDEGGEISMFWIECVMVLDTSSEQNEHVNVHIDTLRQINQNISISFDVEIYKLHFKCWKKSTIFVKYLLYIL